MKKKEINIKELSKITGFSVATVSRALNGLVKGNMKKETYIKIIKTANNYQYIPNRLSIGLRSGLTKIVGIIFPSNINPYYAMLVNLIEEKAFKNGYLTYVCNSNYDPIREFNYIKMLKAQMVSGILLCNTGISKSVLEELDNRKSPIILLDEEVKNYHGFSIILDDFKGGYLGTAFLINNHCFDIAFITGPKKLNSTTERLKGAYFALKENGLDIIKENIFYGDYSIEAGEKITAKIFLKKNVIKAIFCFNDLMAIGASNMLRKLNIKIPEEVSILGYDNIIFSKLISPSISTVATSIESIAEATLNVILNIRSGKRFLKKKFIIAPYLIERESTLKRN